MSCDGVLKMLGSKPCIYYNQHQNEIQHELSLAAIARALCACGGDCARATATPEGNAVGISDSLDHAVQEQALNAGVYCMMRLVTCALTSPTPLRPTFRSTPLRAFLYCGLR